MKKNQSVKKSPLSFTDELSRDLAETPKTMESTKAMFFTKGIILIVFGLLMCFSATKINFFLPYIFAGFMVINGLIMIASGLLSEKINPSFQVTGLVLGGLSIIIGVSPLILPATLMPVIGSMIVLGIALDAFFTMSSLLFLVKNASSKWWAIIAGLISVVFLIGFFFYANFISAPLWLALYALAQGLFYSLTPILFANSKKGA